MNIKLKSHMNVPRARLINSDLSDSVDNLFGPFCVLRASIWVGKRASLPPLKLNLISLLGEKLLFDIFFDISRFLFQVPAPSQTAKWNKKNTVITNIE